MSVYHVYICVLRPGLTDLARQAFMQFSAGGIHAIQRRRDADIICVLGGMGRSRTCYNLLQLVTTCYNLLQLDHTDQHCLCAVGAVTHVTRVEGFACSDLA